MHKPIDFTAYREAPAKIVGMKRSEALAFMEENNFPGVVAREDGKDHMIIAIVQILLNVKDGVVVGTELDGDHYGVW